MRRAAMGALLLLGCAHTGAATTAAPASAAVTASPTAADSAPADAKAARPATFKEALERGRAALKAERYDEAEAAFAAARPLAVSDDQQIAWTVYAATVPLARGDFTAARRHYEDGTARFTHAPKRAWMAALMHNSLTWVRWAAGDPDGALVENEAVRATVEPPAVDADTRRSWLLHYWWDRAYLLAEAGRRPDADKARMEFERLADRPDDRDSRLVLAAWLAVQRGDGAAARAAAAKVDLASDGDVQDLYVLVRAFDAGGDATEAARVRAKIAAADPYPMKPLIVRQLAADAARAH